MDFTFEEQNPGLNEPLGLSFGEYHGQEVQSIFDEQFFQYHDMSGFLDEHPPASEIYQV